MENSEYISLIQWLGQQNHYNEMLRYAKEANEAYPTNEDIRILLSLALFLCGCNREALKELSEIADRSKSVLPALTIQCKIMRNTGQDGIGEIEMKIKECRRKAMPQSLAITAIIHLILREFGKANEYADKAYKSDPMSHIVCNTKGWCEMSSQIHGRSSQNFTDYFNIVLKEDGKNLSALLGAAHYKGYQKEHAEAIAIMNKLIVRYPNLYIPLVDKMMNQLALRDWDMVLDTASRILSIDSNNIEALKSNALVAICRDCDFNKGVQYLKQLFKTINHREPKNATMVTNAVQLFSRITNGNNGILTELCKVMEKLIQQQQVNNLPDPELLIIHGNLCLKMGNIKEAENCFRNSIKINDSSFPPLVGLAHCQLLDTSPGAAEVAQQQLEFLMESQHSNSNVSAEIYYMSAKLFKNKDSIKAMGYFEDAAKAIQKECLHLPYGYDYLVRLNPDLCTKLINEYLIHLPSNSFNSMDKNSFQNTSSKVTDNSCLQLLEILTEACPGFSDILLILAKIQMQLGDLEGAKVSLKKLLDVADTTNASGYLLMAQILVRQSQYHQASQTLESGVSCNFEVRNDPMYHVITGILVKEEGNYEGCIQHFKDALSVIRQNSVSGGTNAISMAEKTTLYLELISAYSKLKKFDDALRLMEEARSELTNTVEEGRIVIGNAELSLETGDIDKAIYYLSEVTSEAPYFLQAHKKLADIYLKYRKDRQKFAQCYRELVERCPGPKTYVMLGDAYMTIQEPERAIEAYEIALGDNTKDKVSARKMGQALMKTHQYKKAIDYYKEAIKNDGSDELKLDLAELYMKMKQFNNAETILLQSIKDNREALETTNVDLLTKQLRTLAKVREKCGNIKTALGTLKEAIEILARQNKRVATSLIALEQKQLVAQLCLEAAEYASTLRDFDQAASYYKEALNYVPTDVTTLLSLAKLYMQTNNLETCAQTCSTILTTDRNNEAASVMLADLAFRRVDFETAAYHFRQILIQRPTYWTALARLIEVSRRMNNMEELEEWLNRAKDCVQRSKDEAGFYYCAGLLDWRLGKMNSALRHFNLARRDPEWGQQAIYNMIEICLDPDDDSTLSSEVFNDDDAEYQDTRTIALKTVQRLLQELNPKGSPNEILTRRLLGNFFLLATKQKSNIEKALQDCTTLASQEALKDHVGPALGLAMAHILLKQTPRARNHLKRVSKNTWTFEDAEYLERCWILLANIYLQSNKYEMANDLLKRVLQYNATCVKAHELVAYIAEKEQNYQDAVTHYNQAWKFGGKLKLSVGYKLAYCCFKSKLYADAIDASYDILRQNPDYPRIRKEILDKSINNLRT